MAVAHPNNHNSTTSADAVASSATTIQTVTYNPEVGVTLTCPANSSTIIAPGTIICLLKSSNGDYTLLHSDGTELFRTNLTSPPTPLLQRFLYRSLPRYLTPPSEVTILISTASGNGTAELYHDNVLGPVVSILGVTPTVIRTTSAQCISSTTMELHTCENPQTLILLAGDTGLNDALNAVSVTPASPTTSVAKLTLAIFPHGTGNALSSSLHTSRLISPLAALLFGESHPLPTFTARFSPGSTWASGRPVTSTIGAVVMSWGFHASLVSDAETLRASTLGTERFKVAAERNLDPPHPYAGTLSIRPPGEAALWRTIARDTHFYTLATMCSNLEEIFRISPSSRLGERAIRVVHFAPMEAGDVMSMMGGAYHGGTHVDDERVGYEVAQGVRIEVREEDARWRRVCVDGGTVLLPRGGWVELLVDEDPSVDMVWRD